MNLNCNGVTGAKKGRGRPKKTEEPEEEEQPEDPKPKSRGRKPVQPTVPEEEHTSEEEEEEHGNNKPNSPFASDINLINDVIFCFSPRSTG